MIVKRDVLTTLELAKWYDQKYTEMGGCWHTPKAEAEAHLERAGVQAGQWVLDVGCGDGSFLDVVWAKDAIGDGIEISEVAVRWARERGRPVALAAIDGPPEALPHIPYDWVFALGSLEHVIDIGQALRNIYALLKLEGRWYFYVPNEKWEHWDQVNERTATVEEWQQLFAAHGLVTEQTWTNGDCVALWGGKA